MEGEEKNLIEYRFENSPLDKSLRSSKLSSGLSLQINLSTQSLRTPWFQFDMKAFKGELFLLSFINTTHLMEAKLLIEKQQQSLIEQSKMSALGQMSGGMAQEKFKTKGVRLEVQLNGNENRDHYIIGQ